MKTFIPYFPGFYQSSLASDMDQEIECEMRRLQEEHGVSQDAAFEACEKCYDYAAARLAISQSWLKSFSDEYGMPAIYEALDSPREYNFTTDRLLADVPEAFLRGLYDCRFDGTLGEHFADVLKRRFTSYDGFISLYSNDPEEGEWNRPFDEWDENQLETLIMAYVDNTGENYACSYFEVYEAAAEGWTADPSEALTKETSQP